MEECQNPTMRITCNASGAAIKSFSIGGFTSGYSHFSLSGKSISDVEMVL